LTAELATAPALGAAAELATAPAPIAATELATGSDSAADQAAMQLSAQLASSQEERDRASRACEVAEQQAAAYKQEVEALQQQVVALRSEVVSSVEATQAKYAACEAELAEKYATELDVVRAEAAAATMKKHEERDSELEKWQMEVRTAREELASIRLRARHLAEEKDDEIMRLKQACREAKPAAPSTAATAPVTPRILTRSTSPTSSLSPTAAATPGPPADILLHSAREQAHRDVELARLQHQANAAQRRAEEATEAASRANAKATEMQRQLRRSQASSVDGYLKEVVLKFLMADEEAAESILPVLSSVLQFSPEEVHQLHAFRQGNSSGDTVSLLSSFFFAPPPPEQDHFNASINDAHSRPLVQPRSVLRPAHPADQGGAGAALTPAISSEGESVQDLKRKVSRLKRLLHVANTHLTRLRESGHDAPAVDDAPN